MKMKRKNLTTLLTGALGLVGATQLGGCPQQQMYNAPPEVQVSEKDGKEIKATEGVYEFNGEKYDKVLILPVAREDLANGLEFLVTASDSDGPMPLTANFYASPSTPLNVEIGKGTNEKYSTSWQTTLSGNDLQLGTYLVATAEAYDGWERTRVPLLAAVFAGPSIDDVVDLDDKINEHIEDTHPPMPPVQPPVQPPTQPPVQPPTQPTQLERVISRSCGISRPNGIEIDNYRIDAKRDGTFAVTYLPELIPNANDPAAEGNAIHNIIPIEHTDKCYFVFVAGTGFGNQRMSSNFDGISPSSCSHIYIVNPTLETVPSGVYTIGVDSTYQEVTRVREGD